MAIFTVGPNSTFPSIAAAMAAAGPGDTIQLEADYSNETATVTHSGMIITGEASSLGIVLELGSGIATVTLAGEAPIDLLDAADGNGIIGNDGDNLITVTAGADAVSGGLGTDRLFVDYRLATGAVTGDSTSNFAEAGGGARLVTVNGGVEHYTIWTGSGADTITTGAGDDDIRTGEGAGTITAGEGFNHIVGGSGADTITAGAGGNFVDGGDGTNTVTTGGGVDEILSGRGADTIVAGAGEDRITALGGADSVDTGADSDLLIVDYSAAVTAVTGGVTGGDLIAGYTGHIADLAGATLDFVGTERFWITTGSGDDEITTGAADDIITTGAGDDAIDGGGGADGMTGGLGDDVYFVDHLDDLVIEAGGEGRDIAFSTASHALASGSEVEVLSAFDNGAAGALDLHGNEFANLLWGNAGVNLLTGGAENDTFTAYAGNDTVMGDDGDDWLDGGDGDDALHGGAGNDTMVGAGGNDYLDGGEGSDGMYGQDGDDIYLFDDHADFAIEAAGQGQDIAYTSASHSLIAGSEIEILSALDNRGIGALDLHGNALANRLWGNDGVNLLSGGAGNDSLAAFDGNDALIGGEGDDWLDGGAGDDALHGSAGNDTMVGAGGNDYLDGGEGADGMYGQDGDDVYLFDQSGDFAIEAAGQGQDIAYTSLNYALTAGSEIEILSATDNDGIGALDLYGNELTNQLWGNGGVNFLSGGAGNDRLIALGGNDTLNGGEGDDWLDGGAGTDQFAFTATLGAGNVDTISGFTQGEDGIALDDAVFTGLALGGLPAGAFVIGAAAQDGDDRIVYDSATGQLLFDADGNGSGAAVLFASLEGAPILSASDFVVI